MTELEAIRVRHSVRAYESRRIEPEKAELLKALIREVNAGSRLHFQLLEEPGKTFHRLMSRAMGLSSAPAVIACVGPEGPGLEERIGYYGEKLVLAAQCMGLNTCWVGAFNKAGVPAEVGAGERLVIVIAIGYGETQGKQRKSKTPAQVSAAPENHPAWFDFAVDMALRAPTAINQQSFEIRLGENGEVSFSDRGGPFSRVDLGIVKYHFTVAAEAGKKGEAGL